MSLRRDIVRGFKSRGLSLRPKAVAALESVLKREEDVANSLELIIDTIKSRVERHASSSVVDEDVISAVVNELTKNEEDLALESVQVFDAFKLPRLAFDVSLRQYKMEPASSLPLQADAAAKITLYRQRFELIRQRLFRNELFKPKIVGGASSGAAALSLTPINALSTGSASVPVVLGMLVRNENGSLCLEDETGQVPISVDDAHFHVGLFSTGSTVLAQGIMAGGTLSLQTLGFPPPERRADTLQTMQKIEFLGMNHASADYEVARRMEKEADSDNMVFLSDVHLDSASVMNKLQQLFGAFDALKTPPRLFVLMGNFLSHPFGKDAEDHSALGEAFDELAALIKRFPNVARNSHFVFVPGPGDPGHGGLLPQRAIPRVFTRRVREVLHRATFVSNPCRIRFFTQELCFIRANVVETLLRCALHKPEAAKGTFTRIMREHSDGRGAEAAAQASSSIRKGTGMGAMEEEEEEEEESTAGAAGGDGGATALDSVESALDVGGASITQHVIKTILDQGHLCPLTDNQQPVFWEFDHALRLHPLPDLLVLADSFPQYQERYADAMVCNPGSFADGGGFYFYRPADRVLDPSQCSPG